MELFHLVYFLFCAGFAIAHSNDIKGFPNRVGVAIITFIFCPLFLGVAVHEYLNTE